MAVALLYAVNFPARAIEFVRGQVEYVRTHDADVQPGWAPPRAWLTLKGVTAVSDCPLFHTSVLFVINDKHMFSMALAAQLAGKQLTVAVDPARRINGYCVASYLTTGDPPPLY